MSIAKLMIEHLFKLFNSFIKDPIKIPVPQPTSTIEENS